MSHKTCEFAKIINDVEAMTEDRRRIIADGHEDDEQFTISADDYASDDDFQRTVVIELMRLFDLK